jgi:uncharacterized protein
MFLMRLSRWAAGCLLLGCLLATRPVGATPADELLASLRPTADVNDFAGVLPPAEREALEQRCRQLRERTGAQLAVVIVRSLQGGQIDDFAVRLFQRWGIGQAGKNNGVLLLVALEDRKARIEVGYGLEPVLPDVLASRILREQLFPAFRQQQYAEGLTAAVHRIAEIVERNEPAPREAARPQLPVGAMVCVTMFLLVWVSIPSLLLGASLRAKKLGPSLFLSAFPAFACFMTFVSDMPWMVTALVLVWSLGAALLGFFIKELAQSRGGTQFGPWDVSVPSWRSGGSSWSSGGFSSGGGWGGFGGGSSGGGGASGGW